MGEAPLPNFSLDKVGKTCAVGDVNIIKKKAILNGRTPEVCGNSNA